MKIGFLGELLQFGTTFDWISPILSVAGDVANGGGHTFLIPQDCGWTGMEIANLLRRKGVQTWGHMIVNGTFMITVRQTQAEYARYLLEHEGLPTGMEAAPQGVTETTRSYGLGDLLQEIGIIRF